jgi:GT2 family glycosyltransferase
VSRRLDIGLVAYGNDRGVEQALVSMKKTMQTDYRVLVVVNPHPTPERNEAVLRAIGRQPDRVVIKVMEQNVGYAGGVNEILKWAETEYIAYSDHDAAFLTPGWDEWMAGVLDRRHEIGMLFPNGGPAPLPRGEYTEILWGVGCAWMLTRLCYADVGGFDTEIGHQEEVDYQTRVRLAGYKIAAIPDIRVSHAASSSSNPANIERINRGVRNWVNKWCTYFCGKNVNYHSDYVLRHEDWHPIALHMEQFFLAKLGPINAAPEVITVDGVEYDLIRVPRLKGFYRNRII